MDDVRNDVANIVNGNYSIVVDEPENIKVITTDGIIRFGDRGATVKTLQ